MKIKINLFIIIALVLCCFAATPLFAAQTTNTYTYDDLNRLETVELEQSDGTYIYYNYDEIGNIELRTSILNGNLDDDDDGLNNVAEFINGTNPTNSDTDSDGMWDGWEFDNGLDPLSNDADDDPDNDGASYSEEYFAGTNPNIPTHLVLDNETIFTGEVRDYLAENSITARSDYIIESGADVTFKAGKIVTLEHGFSAKSGSYFSATIE